MGTTIMMIQAPWVNLVTAITTPTTPVATAPKPLTHRPRFQPGSLSVRWRFAMPPCDSVNDVNTPMA